MQNDINKVANIFNEARYSFVILGIAGLIYSLLLFAELAFKVKNATYYAGIIILALFSVAGIFMVESNKIINDGGAFAEK